MESLREALQALATGKAGGIDDVQPELWKALLHSPEACGALLVLFQKCCDEKSIPEEWHTSIVALLHKKGIRAWRSSLLAIGYQLLAWTLLKRIQRGGAERSRI